MESKGQLRFPWMTKTVKLSLIGGLATLGSMALLVLNAPPTSSNQVTHLKRTAVSVATAKLNRSNNLRRSQTVAGSLTILKLGVTSRRTSSAHSIQATQQRPTSARSTQRSLNNYADAASIILSTIGRQDASN